MSGKAAGTKEVYRGYYPYASARFDGEPPGLKPLEDELTSRRMFDEWTSTLPLEAKAAAATTRRLFESWGRNREFFYSEGFRHAADTIKGERLESYLRGLAETDQIYRGTEEISRTIADSGVSKGFIDIWGTLLGSSGQGSTLMHDPDFIRGLCGVECEGDVNEFRRATLWYLGIQANRIPKFARIAKEMMADDATKGEMSRMFDRGCLFEYLECEYFTRIDHAQAAKHRQVMEKSKLLQRPLAGSYIRYALDQLLNYPQNQGYALEEEFIGALGCIKPEVSSRLLDTYTRSESEPCALEAAIRRVAKEGGFHALDDGMQEQAVIATIGAPSDFPIAEAFATLKAASGRVEDSFTAAFLGTARGVFDRGGLAGCADFCASAAAIAKEDASRLGGYLSMAKGLAQDKAGGNSLTHLVEPANVSHLCAIEKGKFDLISCDALIRHRLGPSLSAAKDKAAIVSHINNTDHEGLAEVLSWVRPINDDLIRLGYDIRGEASRTYLKLAWRLCLLPHSKADETRLHSYMKSVQDDTSTLRVLNQTLKHIDDRYEREVDLRYIPDERKAESYHILKMCGCLKPKNTIGWEGFESGLNSIKTACTARLDDETNLLSRRLVMAQNSGAYQETRNVDIESLYPRLDRHCFELMTFITRGNYGAIRAIIQRMPNAPGGEVQALKDMAERFNEPVTVPGSNAPDISVHEAVHNRPGKENIDVVSTYMAVLEERKKAESPGTNPDSIDSDLTELQRIKTILEMHYRENSSQESANESLRTVLAEESEKIADKGLIEAAEKLGEYAAAGGWEAATRVGDVRQSIKERILSRKTDWLERLPLLRLDLAIEQFAYFEFTKAAGALKNDRESLDAGVRLIGSMAKCLDASGLGDERAMAVADQIAAIAGKEEINPDDPTRVAAQLRMLELLSVEYASRLAAGHKRSWKDAPAGLAEKFVSGAWRNTPLRLAVETVAPRILQNELSQSARKPQRQDMLTLLQVAQELARLTAPKPTESHVHISSDTDPQNVPREWFGGKAHNLALMAHAGLPVPEAFALQANADASDDETLSVIGKLEAATGRELGKGDSPLLVSVRSSGRVSMPGMMDTVLYVGMNDDVLKTLADTHGERFAYDCYERFLRGYGTAVLGMNQTAFKERADVYDPKELVGQHLQAISEAGFEIPPAKEQVINAVKAVHKSWNCPRARAFRANNGIPDEWHSGAVIQDMAYGNMGERSGSGVMFTRDNRTGEKSPMIEFLSGASGEDIVSGFSRANDKIPAASKERMIGYGEVVERLLEDMGDIEFTIEKGDPRLLQCRRGKRTPHAAIRIAVDLANEGLISNEQALSMTNWPTLKAALDTRKIDDGVADTPIAAAEGSTSGAAHGWVAHDPETAQALTNAGKPYVYFATTLRPEDYPAISGACAVVAKEGGLTSHAALICTGNDIPALLGCDFTIDQKEGTISLEGKKLVCGTDQVTVDANRGRLYDGELRLQSKPLPPEAGILDEWLGGVEA
jgi:phosphohistidine swiveling domain-containing protein